MMSNEIYIKKLIDERNEEIFKKVSEKFVIKFAESNNGEHSVHSINNDITFFIPKSIFDVDSFSHELLHAYMDYYDVRLTSNFKLTMWQSNIFTRLFDTHLSEHITNSISHTLMLPHFLNLGFDRSRFLFDYYEYKCEPGFINQISKFYRQGNKFSLSAIRNFIGKYFAFKCDPNPEFDYSQELKQLKMIDNKLFNIINDYYRMWDRYDFTNDEYSEFREKNSLFYISLKPWLNGKTFTD